MYVKQLNLVSQIGAVLSSITQFRQFTNAENAVDRFTNDKHSSHVALLNPANLALARRTDKEKWAH